MAHSTDSRLLFGINVTLYRSNGSILPPPLMYKFDTLLEYGVVSFLFIKVCFMVSELPCSEEGAIFYGSL